MPFDDRSFPLPADPARAGRRAVAVWLFGVCFMILVMIALGGATRLTGSGLSIMEWAPLSGALPPLTHAAWQRLFDLYRQIPQYRLEHPGMDLDGFRRIFWLEWTHRLWGRLLGVAFLLPLVWFWLTKRIPHHLRPRLVLIFALGGLQGAVGWFMVASGFLPASTAVAPLRLEVHLALALLLYSAILWTGLSVLRPTAPALFAAFPRARAVRLLVTAAAVLAACTIVAGGLVAGTHAGFDYNTFPLMDGHLVPASYARLDPWWRNPLDNIPAVQFDHRALATLTALAAIAAVATALRVRLPRGARRAVLALGALVLVQFALGVATLLSVVALPLALTHQITAVLVLSAAIVALHAMRDAGEPRRNPQPLAALAKEPPA